MSNHDRSKQRDEPIKAKFLTNTCNLLKKREKSRAQGAIALVLLPIGWQTGAEFLSQSLEVAIAKRAITCDRQRSRKDSDFKLKTEQKSIIEDVVEISHHLLGL